MCVDNRSTDLPNRTIDEYLVRIELALQAAIRDASDVGWGQRAAGKDIGQGWPAALDPPEEISLLARRLGLSEQDARILGLVVAPRFSSNVALLYGALGGLEESASELTADVLAALEGGTLLEVHRRYPGLFTKTGALLRMKLVAWENGAVVSTPALRALLVGRTTCAIQGVDHRVGLAPTLIVSQRCKHALDAAEAVWRGRELAPLTLIVGPRGCGHTMAAHRLAQSRGGDLIEIDLSRLPDAIDPMEIVRECRWLGAACLLIVEEPVTPEVEQMVRVLLDQGLDLIVSTTSDTVARRLSSAIRVDLSMPEDAQRRALWSRFLAPNLRADDVDDAWLAFRFRGSARDISLLAESTLTHVRMLERHALVTRDDLNHHSRRALVNDLDHLGALCGPLEGGLDAVTLSPLAEAQMREVVMRVEHRRVVLDKLGFGDVGYGLGTVVLLSGPPGTGKTLSARAVATDLGIPLYRVDLSQIVSKWVGETEKHLDACFAEAESAGVALLFDEADTLFAKRSSNSGSDRGDNLKVGYLLQRIEAFSGLCFLTTNLARGVDSAFLRRVSVHVHLDLPEEDQRGALWRAALEHPDLTTETIDVEFLAQEFPEMSGADIRNATMQAAFIAAGLGSGVDQSLVEACAARTLRASGALIRSMPHPLERLPG